MKALRKFSNRQIAEEIKKVSLESLESQAPNLDISKGPEANLNQEDPQETSK